MNIKFSKPKYRKSVSKHILKQIIKTIRNDKLTDFEIVEEIVCLFEKYDIDCNGQHDF